MLNLDAHCQFSHVRVLSGGFHPALIRFLTGIASSLSSVIMTNAFILDFAGAILCHVSYLRFSQRHSLLDRPALLCRGHKLRLVTSLRA